MEFLGIILVALLVLGLPVASIVMASLASGRTKGFEARIDRLARECAALRDEVALLRRQGPAGPETAEKQAPQETAPAPIVAEAPSEAPAAEDGEAASLPPQLPPELPPQPVAEVAAQPPKPDLESRIGGRWSVLLGGLTTALGAVLLVRYTIEAGLLGPAARIALGALLSVALLGGGEVLRRRDREMRLPVLPKADVPSMLTAAGVVAAFATAYAAYALYGFIGPAAAFVVLTVVGLAALALSAVHGPGLAALGAVGSYATPLLVSTDEPNLYALVIHVLVVTGSVLGVAVIRGWLWLAFLGVAGASAWTVLEAMALEPAAGVAGMALLLGSALLYAVAFGHAQYGPAQPMRKAEDAPADRGAILAFGAVAAGFAVQAAANLLLPLPAASALLGLLMAACAASWPALAPVALAAAVVALFGIAAQDLILDFQGGLNTADDIRAGLVPPDIASYVRNAAITGAPAAALLAWQAFRSSANAPRFAGWLAWGTAAIAFPGLAIAYLRIAPFETQRLFGAIALALAFAFALGAEGLIRRRPDDLRAHAPAAFAVACAALAGFGLAVSLDTGWFPLGFALAAAGIAVVYGFRPLPALPWLAVAGAVISAGTIWLNHPFTTGALSPTPLFNELILLAGLPAAALVFAGETMRRRGGGVPAAITASFGMAVAGLFVSLELRHWLNAGDMTAQPGLAEVSANALAALGFAIGLQQVARSTGAKLYANATLVAGVISAAIIAIGLVVLENPLFTADPVGPRIVFNTLLPAYLLTAVAAAAVALQARNIRPRPYVLLFAGLGGVLLFLWVSLSIRHYHQGENLAIWRSTSDAEFWTYSAAWLGLGVALLAAGHVLRSFPIRAASGLLIVLTICKVFIFDMAALTGALRAFSFLGLGLSLMAIGRFYQRLLMRPAGGEEPGLEQPGPAPDA